MATGMAELFIQKAGVVRDCAALIGDRWTDCGISKKGSAGALAISFGGGARSMSRHWGRGAVWRRERRMEGGEARTRAEGGWVGGGGGLRMRVVVRRRSAKGRSGVSPSRKRFGFGFGWVACRAPVLGCIQSSWQKEHESLGPRP